MNATTLIDAAPASRLRLALFSGNYNYTRDGANLALNRLVGFLLEAGAAVRVYSPTTPTPAFEPVGDLVSVPSVPIPGRGEYRVALPLSRALRRDVERFAPTAVHLSAPDLLGMQARKLARRLGVPVVSSVHTRFETYLSYYGLGWLRPAAERHLARFYGGCDHLLAPSWPMAELLRAQCPATDIGVWSRGVDRQQFSPARRDTAWRRSVGLADTDVAVLFLGRLVLEKGLEAFVQSFEHLAGDRRLRPMIVGDGPASAWLRRRLPNATFTGFLVGDDLARAIASADVLFNPSRTETFGNATLESMSSGLPVVCPQAPSTRQLLTPGVEGIVVESAAPADYAKVLRDLAADPALRARLGEGGRRASLRYDWRASCAAVLDVYRALGATGPGARPAEAEGVGSSLRSARAKA